MVSYDVASNVNICQALAAGDTGRAVMQHRHARYVPGPASAPTCATCSDSAPSRWKSSAAWYTMRKLSGNEWTGQGGGAANVYGSGTLVY